MITRTASRSSDRNLNIAPVMAISLVCLALNGCAEIELSAEVFKNIPRASNNPPAPPILQTSVRQDNIEPSLRPDPEAFQATGLALWDGSRTLQGVWIAHPAAAIARRVRLTNNETGARVDAAMFRRDQNLSGPQIIVSSDAARLLGLAPGRYRVAAWLRGFLPLDEELVLEQPLEDGYAFFVQLEFDEIEELRGYASR